MSVSSEKKPTIFFFTFPFMSQILSWRLDLYETVFPQREGASELIPIQVTKNSVSQVGRTKMFPPQLWPTSRILFFFLNEASSRS